MRITTFDFTDAVVLVTGAGSGIGRAIAAAFLDAGATVVVTGRRPEPLQELLSGYPEEQGLALPGDVAERGQVFAAVATIIERFGRLDVVISNAGTWIPGQLSDVSVEGWEQMRSINVDGFFHLAQATLPHLVDSVGTLIAVSSVSGERGDWGHAAYNATKAAISQFVRSLALDYGAQGVRVNAVAPAFTVTDATKDAVEIEEVVAAATNRTALGRLGQPDDIAPAVLFLASDQAAYVTGVVMPVDGGTMASTGQAHIG